MNWSSVLPDWLAFWPRKVYFTKFSNLNLYVYQELSPTKISSDVYNCCCSVTSHVWFFATQWTAAHQASLSHTISWNLPKFMSIASAMPSSHLILWHSLLLSFSLNSVAQLCLAICDTQDFSTPGFPVHHQLPDLAQTHAYQVGDTTQPSYLLTIPFSSWPQFLLASGSFPMSQLFAWGGQSTGVSALASFLPMNTQDWSPSEWTGWIVHFKKHVVMEIIKITTITLTLMHQVLLWVRSVPSMLQSRES